MRTNDETVQLYCTSSQKYSPYVHHSINLRQRTLNDLERFLPLELDTFTLHFDLLFNGADNLVAMSHHVP